MRWVTRQRIVIAALLAVAVGGLILAGSRAQTGEPDSLSVSGADVVERLIPSQGAEVLRQSEVGVDLASGWTGVLTINGTEIPEGELRIEDSLNLVVYQPGEGKTIEALPAGPNTVQATVWRIAEGRSRARSINWQFEVT